jgi:ferrochelatase
MKGALVVNLGTPKAPDPASVGAFLWEFLSDPMVIDLPRWIWLPILKLVIIPLRRYRSAAAYKKIWTPEGSPLLTGTERLTKKLMESLEGESLVKMAMSYGNPAIGAGLKELREAGVSRLTVLPLYPQYSRTTTESVFSAVSKELKRMNWSPELKLIQNYHDADGWVKAVAESIREFQISAGKPDKLMFSLHGIPQRYVDNGDPYATQCEKSVRDIVSELQLTEDEWVLTYQSRVGREPWLKPYTDLVLKDLGPTSNKHMQVVCPGFSIDCLETLEEIAMQNKEFFLDAGGERLEYIPALNDRQSHVDVLQGLLRNQSP